MSSHPWLTRVLRVCKPVRKIIDDLRRIFFALPLLASAFGFFRGVLRDFGRPSLFDYNSLLIILMLCSVGGMAVWRFRTKSGHRVRERQLRTLLSRFEHFDNEKQLETISRVWSRALIAAMFLLFGLLAALPVAGYLLSAFSRAIVLDVTNNISGTHWHEPPAPELFLQIFGSLLGVIFGAQSF